MNTASTISQREAYKLMLKEYPDVMSIEQMCEILCISIKTGYRILREGKICCSRSAEPIVFRRLIFLLISASDVRRQQQHNLGLEKFTKKCVSRSSNSNPVLVQLYQVIR